MTARARTNPRAPPVSSFAVSARAVSAAAARARVAATTASTSSSGARRERWSIVACGVDPADAARNSVTVAHRLPTADRMPARPETSESSAPVGPGSGARRPLTSLRR